MKPTDKICHRVAIKSEKERQLYKKREEKELEGTPKITMGKSEANMQEIWTEDIKNQPVARLKETSNLEKAQSYAKKIMGACCVLSQHYGYFMINENMIFLNAQKEIFTWINPDVRENHVKIYLPHTHDGEMAMIKSIINYFKLWFKCDYNLLTDVKHLSELAHKIETMKIKPSEAFRAKSPDRDFMLNRRNSVNMDSIDMPQRQEQSKHAQNLLADNKSMRDVMSRSPGKQDPSNFLTSSLSNKITSPLKFAHQNSNEKDLLKNRTTLNSDKNQDNFEHRTFNNMNSGGPIVVPINKSLGGNHYYPNKTTSNANGKHHIVAMINQQDSSPQEYGKNKLVLDERRMTELERGRPKGKECLDGIGEELNDLFVSSIENEEQSESTLMKVEQEFSSLLE